jgi:hypothetical protein
LCVKNKECIKSKVYILTHQFVKSSLKWCPIGSPEAPNKIKIEVFF